MQNKHSGAAILGVNSIYMSSTTKLLMDFEKCKKTKGQRKKFNKCFTNEVHLSLTFIKEKKENGIFEQRKKERRKNFRSSYSYIYE